MLVRFLLVCEGPTDTPLERHLADLLVLNGATEVDSATSYRGNRVTDKIRYGIQHAGPVDLLFVHRDADSDRETRSAGPMRRLSEIENAIQEAEFTGPWVAVIPVQETEAWLLLDEPAIRRVAGRPTGTEPPGLPSPNLVEGIRDPKAVLEEALTRAAAVSGNRKSREFNRSLPELRRQLLENLRVGGPLEQLPSWRRFRDDTLAALRELESMV